MPTPTASEPNTCLIYCRVSSKEQVEGTSLENQERLCQEYAARNGLKVLKVFVEMGESAKTVDRTEFTKAIAFCTKNKGRVHQFIVYKIDRFARNQDDHVVVRNLLRRAGTELRSATETFDESSMGRAMEGMLSVFAEFDNNNRRERCKSGMQARMREGIWVWPSPIGYHKPTNGKGTNIAPDPATAPLIRLAFEEYSKGIYTYRAIAELLTARGLVTKNGKSPSFQLVEKIIHNPIYCGRIEAFDEVVQGKFEPIISESLFNNCQGIVDGVSASITPRSANNPLFPLRSFVKCSECREPITGSYSTGRRGVKYPYYHHHGRLKCLISRSIPKETFEQSFVEFLKEITPKSEYLALFRETVMDVWKSNYQHFDSKNAKINKEIQKMEEERQRIFDLHRAEKYTDAEFEEQKRLVNARIAQKRAQLQVGWSEELDMEKALSHCLAFVTNAAKAWLMAEYEIRLQYQGSTCPNGLTFDGKNCRTDDLSLVYELNQALENEKTPSGDDVSSLVAPRGVEPLLTA